MELIWQTLKSDLKPHPAVVFFIVRHKCTRRLCDITVSGYTQTHPLVMLGRLFHQQG